VGRKCRTETDAAAAGRRRPHKEWCRRGGGLVVKAPFTMSQVAAPFVTTKHCCGDGSSYMQFATRTTPGPVKDRIQAWAFEMCLCQLSLTDCSLSHIV
jgi:hypothetical protein